MRWILTLALLMNASLAWGREPIRLANNPALSPDGKLLAFDWNGDIWLASSEGGAARPLTSHAGRDVQPKFSPDGKEIAFISDREGSPQVFVIPTEGGAPVQLTFHTGGCSLLEYVGPDKLLIKAARDHHWRQAERFFLVQRHGRKAEQILFDDYGSDGTLSPDGTKLLFTREGDPWWRKGNTGSRVSQLWMYEPKSQAFTKLLHQTYGSRWPLWKPDGTGFYYVAEEPRGSNLHSYDLAAKQTRKLTSFPADSVVFPAIARNGSLIAFRQLFDLYTFNPQSNQTRKLDLWHDLDRVSKKQDRRVLTSATAASFAKDGLEIAFISGGDLWVMDTELREPRQITRSPGEETSPLFSADGNTIYFSGPKEGKFAIWKATRKDPKRFWWQNREFNVEPLVENEDRPTELRLTPDGSQLAYVLGRGDLWLYDFAKKAPKRILAGWSEPDFDFSPDGKWIVYAIFDNDFNRDVYLAPIDGSQPAYNLSRHPFTEGDPVWSPDGKMVAFAGHRANGDSGANISLVWLKLEDDERTAYDRKLEKALDKMKSRPAPTKPGEEAKKDEPKKEDVKKEETKKDEAKKPEPFTVDTAGLHERVRRINLGEGSANVLFWSPDSKKLAFTGSYEGKSATFAIDVNDSLKPKELTSVVGRRPTWLKQGNQIVWLVDGVPTSTAISGAAPAPTTAAVPPTATKKGPIPLAKPVVAPTPAPSGGGSYSFSTRQDIDLVGKRLAVFDTCWRILRDNWYDPKFGNNDWNQIRAKYRPLVAEVPDLDAVAVIVQLMLGELNGSHLGFTLNPTDAPKATAPRDVTAHLGVRFEAKHQGPGLLVRDVLPTGPADKKRSKIDPGEVILEIDGKAVDPTTDLTEILNGLLDRDIVLKVKAQNAKEREVTLKPISTFAASELLYEQWLKHNRDLVAKASAGKLGYLHISQMSMPTFRKFEEELVSQGAGRDGLVIDVRENPGGSTADHLLTALTQPMHAITVPRGGGPGYPQDRKVYVSWHKPIVVLCNQNSGSNAEIFSHAIKTLKRGQVVGVPTAGAVISTGAAPVMDVGLLRLPFRGWFLVDDGEDMEKHGAVPHHLLWPAPTDMPAGRDAQLAKAVEVLLRDVDAYRARPMPKLKYSTER